MAKKHPGSPLFHMRMPQELLDWFRDYSQRTGKPMTAIIREHLEELMRQDRGKVAGGLQVAIGAVRSQLRSMGLDPEQTSADDALKVLDDISRTGLLMASCKYAVTAPGNVQ